MKIILPRKEVSTEPGAVHVLATGKTHTDLGPDFYARRTDPGKETQRLLARLEALGHKVTLEPAA